MAPSSKPDNKRDNDLMTSAEAPEVIISQEGPLGLIQLNRPGALNALTLEMVRMIAGALRRWKEDASVQAVLVFSQEGRAFCAGGDIKAAYRLGMRYRRGEAPENTLTLFFEEEYEFNSLIFHYKKPIIAFMDGITMGGGYGLAGPCSFRVITDKTVFAMPETKIGFFPDVGSMYFLSRCPGKTGCYLAVTGNSLGPADTIYAGLADYYIPGISVGDLKAGIRASLAGQNAETTHDVLHDSLDKLSSSPEGSVLLKENNKIIDAAFSRKTIQDLLGDLSSTDDEFAAATRQDILSRSPTSVKIALNYYHMAANMDFDDILDQDLVLAEACLKQHDFYEGVRAMVIDKDRNPRWDPDSFQAVTDDVIQRYLTPQA